MQVVSKLALVFAAAIAPAAVAAPASYQVPVDADLRPYATFPLDGASVTKGDDSAITIVYCLPQDITGATAPTITLTGVQPASDGEFFAVGDDKGTKGQCVATATALTCMLHYAGLTVDPNQMATYLQAKYPNDPSLPQRLGVMRAFAGDPVGILSVDL